MSGENSVLHDLVAPHEHQYTACAKHHIAFINRYVHLFWFPDYSTHRRVWEVRLQTSPNNLASLLGCH